MGRNGLAEIIRLSLTPTAKRNSYRVAILMGALPRVAGCARNPGLCNRNSVRVAGGAYLPTEAPSQPSPRGRSHIKPPKTQQVGTPAPWGGMGRGTYGLPPLGEGWGGAPMNSRPLGRDGKGHLWTPAPWGGMGRGFGVPGRAFPPTTYHIPDASRSMWRCRAYTGCGSLRRSPNPNCSGFRRA